MRKMAITNEDNEDEGHSEKKKCLQRKRPKNMLESFWGGFLVDHCAACPSIVDTWLEVSKPAKVMKPLFFLAK